MVQGSDDVLTVGDTAVILDYVERTRAFTLQVPRSSGLNPNLVRLEHGLDYSTTASTPEMAVLFTREPYAAATFGEYATPRARQELGTILTEIEASRAPVGAGHYDVPLDKELWPYQAADLDYGLRRKHWLDADEPGLGKTPTAIVYCNELRAKRVLVACTAAIRRQWAERIKEWSTMSRYLGRGKFWIHTIENAKHGVNPDAEWTLVSYDLLRTPAIGRALAAGTYDVLILDEAHMLKTIDSRRTRAIFGGGEHRTFDPLIERAEHVLALTGTPLPNRPREAYTLARGLSFDAIDWMSEERFKERFNPSELIERTRADGSTIRYLDERSGRHSELQNRLRASFMTRHLKREVMKDLHYPVYDLVRADETGPVKAALEAERLLDIDPEDLTGADAQVLGHVATVRREMGVALAPQVAQYVDICLAGGEEKIVLFAWHVEVLDILTRLLYRHGIARVDGRTSASAKERAVKLFQSDPKIKVIVGNVLSLGTGTDGLQHVCNHAIIAEPDWVPGNNVQCFDRLDRGGQRRQVQGDIFVAPGSFAERVLAGALRKGHVIHNALDRRVA
jgi:SWI/SNF-related matrix-associated actin-dependent regulator 1 of chromatin subfamily A